MEQNLNRYFLLLNIPGCIFKFLRSKFVVKECAVLIAIRHSDEGVILLGDFR